MPAGILTLFAPRVAGARFFLSGPLVRASAHPDPASPRGPARKRRSGRQVGTALVYAAYRNVLYLTIFNHLNILSRK